jgi:hypothetical protein
MQCQRWKRGKLPSTGDLFDRAVPLLHPAADLLIRILQQVFVLFPAERSRVILKEREGIPSRNIPGDPVSHADQSGLPRPMLEDGMAPRGLRPPTKDALLDPFRGHLLHSHDILMVCPHSERETLGQREETSPRLHMGIELLLPREPGLLGCRERTAQSGQDEVMLQLLVQLH